MSQLATLLEAKAEVALERWVALIRTTIAPGGETEAELRDHIPHFLRGLIAALRAHAAEAGDPAGKEHGRQRYRIGFDVEALILEYGVLRNVLFDLIEEHELPLTLAEVRIVTDFITNAIAEGVVEHNRQSAARQRHLAEVAETERKKLEAFFETAPFGITTNEGRELRYTFANAAYRETVGGRDVVGKTLFEAVPRSKGRASTSCS